MKGPQTFSGFRNCVTNPKCCYDSHDLECPNKFSPPLLNPASEFCTESLTKGIPIPRCILAKPKKLQIEREPPPLAKPATSRHLKNWQKWCYIWRQTYNKLTAKRDAEVRPPVMSSGEVHRIKKEDKELFDRTLHAYHLTGFYVKNSQFPDSIKPKPCGVDKDIKEVVFKRHLRDFPEMSRHRYPNYVRSEISVPPRKALASKENKRHSKQAQVRPSSGFNWEEQWAKTKHVENMKEMLACDIDLYGRTDPLPDYLIFQQMQLKEGPSERISDKNKNKKGGDLAVPQLVFSVDAPVEADVGAGGGDATTTGHSDERKSSYYTEQRGPILRIRSQVSELLMTYTGTGNDLPHFIGNSTTPFGDDVANESNYLYDEDHHFSITTKCKETKFVVLKNEGTTAIRYQWFLRPPTHDAIQMLQEPPHFKLVRLDTDDCQCQQDKDEIDLNTTAGMATAQSEVNPLKQVLKKTHLEFNFCSLPGIILPGQSLEFPIVFRSKRPGFFHENLYLLTHPRVVSMQDGRSYAVRLSGVCTDVELAQKGNEKYEMEALKRFLSQKALEEETLDMMESILDRALWESTNTIANDTSLPNGRVTEESIFYAHNTNFYYHFGKSEKALELMRQLIDMVVPRERIETQVECNLSLQNLYNLVLKARGNNDLHWSQFSSSECEDLLQRLETECIITLSEQRTFAWPNSERRKYSACYSIMAVTFDEILFGFDKLQNAYNSPLSKLIDQRKSEQMVEEYLLKDQEKNERMAVLTMMEGSTDELSYIFGEVEVNNMPSLKELSIQATEPEQTEEEANPYWFAAFEHMMRPYNDESKYQTRVLPEKSRKPVKDRGGSQDKDQTVADELSAAEALAQGRSESGDAPKSLYGTHVKEEKREITVPTLADSIAKEMKETRLQVLTEARLKLFEDLFCGGIERMLATVDNFNNMLDYRSTDAVVVMEDRY